MMFEVDGVTIKSTLSMYKTRLEAIAPQFAETCWIFPDEEKVHPKEVYDDFMNASKACAELEELQQAFNLDVLVEVQGEQMTLARAVKLVSMAGNCAKMWKTAARDTGRDRYSTRDMTRTAGEIRAKRVVSVRECLDAHRDAEIYATSLRAAIARGNLAIVGIGEGAKFPFSGFRTSLFR